MGARLALLTLTSLYLATTTSSTQQPTFAAAAIEITPTSLKPSLQFAVRGTSTAPAQSKAVIAPDCLQAPQSRRDSRKAATCSLLGDGLLVIPILTTRLSTVLRNSKSTSEQLSRLTVPSQFQTMSYSCNIESKHQIILN